MRVLAHPERVRLLNALRHGPECVCHLTALLEQRQPYVSQQLAYLREAGLIADHKEGLRVYYSIRDPRLFQILDAAAAMAGDSDTQREARSQPPILDTCPCPRCTTAKTKKGGKRCKSKSLAPVARTA